MTRPPQPRTLALAATIHASHDAHTTRPTALPAGVVEERAEAIDATLENLSFDERCDFAMSLGGSQRWRVDQPSTPTRISRLRPTKAPFSVTQARRTRAIADSAARSCGLVHAPRVSRA